MQHQAEPCADIRYLKAEFDKLSEEQLLALRRATYAGMTPQEAKIYDDRRRKISVVARRLSVLLRLQANRQEVLNFLPATQQGIAHSIMSTGPDRFRELT